MDDLVRAVHDALNATASLGAREAPEPPPRSTGTTFPLPVPPPLPAVDLGAVLARRRSRYAFGAAQPTPQEVAALLHLGVGAAPRAGGLPSLVPYVVVRGPGALPAGVHRADLRLPVPGTVAVRTGDPTDVVAAGLDQPPFATRVPLWLALVSDLEVTRERYPARHYRTLHVDAGAALQNVLLVATALGLPVCPVMGFDDEAWARLLDLPRSAWVSVLVAVGSGTTDPPAIRC